MSLPTDLALGMMLRATSHPQNLVKHCMMKAKDELDSFQVETAELHCHASVFHTTTRPPSTVLNPLNSSNPTERATKPTLFMQVLIQGRQHWALVDTGAELTLMGTAFASYTGAVQNQHTNV
jgi:hypothetical protein